MTMKVCLSYDISVFQWITSCPKNRMTTRVITSDATGLGGMPGLSESV